MPNPGSFHGARKEFLMSQRKVYAAAIASKSKAECLMDIQRRYFKRFPIELKHEEDPDPEALKDIDDDAADPEPDIPDESLMSPEEYEVALEAFEQRKVEIAF